MDAVRKMRYKQQAAHIGLLREALP